MGLGEGLGKLGLDFEALDIRAFVNDDEESYSLLEATRQYQC